MNQQTMSSYEWLNQPQYKGLIILDPDGWDRSGIEAFNKSMHEPIEEAQFRSRMFRSTCAWSIHAEVDIPKTMRPT